MSCKNDDFLDCKHREFRDKSFRLRALLGKLEQQTNSCVKSLITNEEEEKYKNYNYNGSFHKSLQHNLEDGRLVSSHNYKKMVKSIVKNDQKKLASVKLAIDSEIKLQNPLASNATILIGAPQCELRINDPWPLSSNENAAEMLEVYSQAIARDVPFYTYDFDPTIKKLLGRTYLNDPKLLKYLYNRPCGKFTPQTIFRGDTFGELIGPYVSQLLLLDIPMGSLKVKQIYSVPPDRKIAKDNDIRVEWGVDLNETIAIQNGNLNLLPPNTPNDDMILRYIFSGRSLAQVTHDDTVYQLFYQATLILLNLGVKPNPGFPEYPNQTSFITNSGSAAVLCAIADVSTYALKHAWYWKWQHYRKLRPEVNALWVNDVKNGLVENKNNFDLKKLLLNSPILSEILNINNFWIPQSNSYTLPLDFREGSSVHSSYPSRRGVVSGACGTILKIYFDSEKSWKSLPGIISGELSNIPNAILQANSKGTRLKKYTKCDQSDITITSEINKLCSNTITGRDWGGLGYRSDCFQGIWLGEKIAIRYMEDLLSTMVENNLNGDVPKITFRKFDGFFYTIKPTICIKK